MNNTDNYEGVSELIARLKMASAALMAHPHLSVWCHAITEAAVELERHSGPKGVLVPFDLWDSIHDFIHDQMDVIDGSYGVPYPNEAMNLFTRIEQEVTSQDGPKDEWNDALEAAAKAIRYAAWRERDSHYYTAGNLAVEAINALKRDSATRSEG